MWRLELGDPDASPTFVAVFIRVSAVLLRLRVTLLYKTLETTGERRAFEVVIGFESESELMAQLNKENRTGSGNELQFI